MPANAPSIKRVADYIRPRVPKSDRTYEVSLAVLFLDRLGDPKDKPLIRRLSLRLIAGQHMTGGWNYRCPILSNEQEDSLAKALVELQKRQKAGESSSAKLLKGLELPRGLERLAVFLDARKLRWQDPPHSQDNLHNILLVGTTDNSNTQFAMLGLWAAQRHDIPVSPTFRLMAERFERSQQADGWWSYELVEPQGSSSRNSSQTNVTQPSMICAGLLGLGIGRGLNLATPGSSRPGATDLRILKSLSALSQDIGIAAGGLESAGTMRGVYYLWSLERVAMLYGLSTIGDKDWYRWGAGLLLASQKANGAWEEVAVTRKDGIHHWGPRIDTSIALLFLNRSHPLKELTAKLPFKAQELNRGIARLLSGAPLEPLTATQSKNDKPGR